MELPRLTAHDEIVSGNQNYTESVVTVSLVTLGPGGVYSTRYVPRGTRLLALDSADEDSQQSPAQSNNRHTRKDSSSDYAKSHETSVSLDQRIKTGPLTLLDRILRIDRVTISREATEFTPLPVTTTSTAVSLRIASLPQIARSWLSGQLVVLEQLRILFERLQSDLALCSVDTNALSASKFDALQRYTAVDAEEYTNEPDSQTIENSSPNKRLSTRTWLFANDAGTRKRNINQQSYRVRTCRSTNKKGRFKARCTQGSLFVNL